LWSHTIATENTNPVKIAGIHDGNSNKLIQIAKIDVAPNAVTVHINKELGDAHSG
jgi:hypothetical protein